MVLGRLFSMMVKTASLFEWKQTCLLAQCDPQGTAAMTTGISSLAAIPVSTHAVGHWSLNYEFRFEFSAPQPNNPDASEYMWLEGLVGRGGKRRDHSSTGAGNATR